MASFGWNSKRFSCSKQNGGKEFEILPKMCIGEDWDSSYRAYLGGNGTSIEVVKDNQICTVNEELAETEKVWEMAWNNKDNEDEWLSKCAIGVLKEFANVSSVNHRLSSRGISFSSKYLGDKCILWIFVSEMEGMVLLRVDFYGMINLFQWLRA